MAKLIPIIKELFKGEDILYKHLSLACIGGLTALLGDTDLSKELIATSPGIAILFYILSLIGTFYIIGYCIEAVHYRLNAGIVVLPEITTKPFGTILRILPLLIVWGLYAGIAALILVVLPILMHIPAIAIIGVIAFTIFQIFIPFAYVAYAKNFQAFGLFKITLPFEFMKYAFLDLVIFAIKYLLIAIGIIGLAFVIAFLIMLINSNLGYAIGLCIFGYASCILNLTWFTGLAEIYEEKIDGMVVEELY